MKDARYALRQLARAPGFSVVAILTLALCIGANSAIFSVIHAILLKPYPWAGSENLAYVYNTYPLMGLQNAGVSIPHLPRSQGHRVLCRRRPHQRDEHEPGRRRGPSAGRRHAGHAFLFSTLQSPAMIGRTLQEGDARPDAPATVVLSHSLWKSRFGADPAVVGRIIRLNDMPYKVVGVMPAGFYFPRPDIDAWTPFIFTPAQRSDQERGTEYSQMIVRLKPGASMTAVQRELDQIQARNAERMPDDRDFWKTSGFDGRIEGFLDLNVKDIRRMLWLVQAAVAAALLIGCGNVAGLLLARAVGREREFAIRTALGASRWRVIRLLLIESLVLFLAGGLLGLVVAVWSIDALKGLGLSTLPRGFGVTLDPSVFLFTLGCAALTGLVFGSLPAWSASRNNPSASLKEAGGRGSAGRRTQRLRSTLVAAEIGVAVMLVATAGLLIESFLRMQHVDPGFAPTNVLTAQVALPHARFDKPEKIEAFDEAVMARLAAGPGVVAAGMTNTLPFSGNNSMGSYHSPDITLPAGAPSPHAFVRVADPGYLRAIGLTLLQGRWFDATDTAKGRHVCVVDRILVDRYWKGQDPIGKRIQLYGPDRGDWFVVGVVARVKVRSLEENSEKEALYFPAAQSPDPMMMFVVRAQGDPGPLAASVREAVRSVDSNIPVFNVRTMTQRMDAAAEPRRAPMVLLSVFSGLAMVLAMLGVEGSSPIPSPSARPSSASGWPLGPPRDGSRSLSSSRPWSSSESGLPVASPAISPSTDSWRPSSLARPRPIPSCFPSPPSFSPWSPSRPAFFPSCAPPRSNP